jgi:hypothetical protein
MASDNRADAASIGAAGGVRGMLRLEGLALLAGAAGLYASLGGGWPMFVVLFLVPDLSFAGYLAGPRIGAAAYNAAHSTLGPLLLGAAGLFLHDVQLQQIACIWGAHVGFDRALGYGLKYATGFGDTHLGRIGRRRAAPASLEVAG